MRTGSTRNSRDNNAGRAPVALLVALLFGITLGAVGVWNFSGNASHVHESSETSNGKKQLWTCGMHPQVIQDKPGTCPICGMALEPMRDDGAGPSPGTSPSGERKIKYWWDPMMNPPYISEKPGKSPMGMDLIPVYEDEVSGGTAVTIDPVVVQNMGVRIAKIEKGPVERSIRAVGYLGWAEPNIHDVNLRISGWIEKLHADTEGMRIEKGQPLFSLYSPELQVAVEELISAKRAYRGRSGASGKDERSVSETLYQTARRKLEQWGVDSEEIDRLSTLSSAPRAVTFRSSALGELIEKNLVEGAAAMMGQRALRIVDRSRVWLDAEVYAMDLPFVKLGSDVTATVEGLPKEELTGKVVFMDPRVDPTTRTVKVRIALPNPRLTLRPGMFATVHLSARVTDEAVLVPREAVLDTGARQVVFVAMDEGHFEPRKVKLGASGSDGRVEVLTGLAPNEQAVVSGQFLLDAESRMKEAIQKHLKDKLLREEGGDPTNVQASHESHGANKWPATGRVFETSGEWQAGIDKVVREYLTLQAIFGKVQEDSRPANFNPLHQALKELEGAAQKPEEEALVASIQNAAQPLSGHSLDQQREGFKAVSALVVKLAQHSPPSQAVAGPDGKLFVAYCPMADGVWLQDTEVMANPYYATEMKSCAVVKQTIAASDHSRH